VGEETIILSALNGITSEEIIGETYGMDKLLYCVAQGMDAVKEDNRLSYEHMGMLVFGGRPGFEQLEKMQAVVDFFDRMQFPYQPDTDMNKRMWGKFMMNVGVNQTAAVSKAGNYGELQNKGPVRERMIAAMREVITLSEKEKINLTEEDLNYWLSVLGTLNPLGKPSMRQDMEAGRRSEVELFAGTVIKLGKMHQLSTLVNQEFYDEITRTESKYDK
jgi:2-dehydropantoate 2-reductase